MKDKRLCIKIEENIIINKVKDIRNKIMDIEREEICNEDWFM